MPERPMKIISIKKRLTIGPATRIISKMQPVPIHIANDPHRLYYCVLPITLACVIFGFPCALSAEYIKQPLHLFDVTSGCQLRPTDRNSISLPNIRMNAHYIASPSAGQDRRMWLSAIQQHRQRVRAGDKYRIIDIDFQGTSTWIRLALPIARAYNLQPSELFHIAAGIRWIQGDNELCFTFDIHSRANDNKINDLEVCTTIPIPKDGQWHQVTLDMEAPSFNFTDQYLRPVMGIDASQNSTPCKLEVSDIEFWVDESDRMNDVNMVVQSQCTLLDRSIYDREDLNWSSKAFACHFTFMFDRSLYDPQAGEYTLDAFLDDGLREFGGYDAMILWQGYPRLGVDERNQYDMYRDMPGGLTGLRDLVRQAHDRGVKVFIDYNPWDTGTRSEGKPYEESLAEMVEAMEIDGIFLDTMSAGSSNLRETIDNARPGVALVPESHPAVEQIAVCSASWAQWLRNYNPTGLLHLKWIEPRHMQYHTRRWDSSHQGEIESAFFNASGMLIWENIFGSHNPYPIEDRFNWRQAIGILRHFSSHFTSEAWDPFYPTLDEDLYAHRWPGEDATVFTMLNYGAAIDSAALLEIPSQNNMLYYDLWNGQTLQTETAGENLQLIGSVDRIGCILAVRDTAVDQALLEFLSRQQEYASQEIPSVDPRNFAASVVDPDPVAGTVQRRCDNPPPGMVFVPKTTFTMHLQHELRESGCYPDPGTPLELQWQNFLKGWTGPKLLTHNIGPVEVSAFFIDAAEVTNAEFKEFLNSTGYTPEHTTNFLKHWPQGQMPEELADHPVVYVDIDDARAYAAWAGKRLPAEEEWHLAAQGTDRRTWPWGNDFDADKCNTTGDRTMPVRSYPDGRSPFGCYHMSGNVWEWTESCRDDGHTRFVMIRGGSYFNAEGSYWYVNGGPQPCEHHAKFIRMWPGLDRCATIGFRCVVDAYSTAGDLSGDCLVDMHDFALLGSLWVQGHCDDCGGADLSGDGNVNMDDLKELVAKWLVGTDY